MGYSSVHGLSDEKVEKRRRKLKGQLKDAGVEGEVVLAKGHGRSAENPAASIVEAAEEHDVDFIVIGAPRKNKERLGSISKHVAKHAQRNVMLAFCEEDEDDE